MILPMLISFLPLLGALIASGLFCCVSSKVAQFSTSALMLIAAILSWYLFFTLGDAHYTVNLLTWLSVGSFQANWALYVDSLSALMFIVVTTVSAVVHLYSIGYMHDDPNIKRFFSYISLFTFCMLMLVSSDNFIQLFFGWEGVGLCSYLLIGFWFKKDSANKAAMKAFIVNRVGDFGLALGIAFIYFIFDSVKFTDVLSNAPLYEQHFTCGIHTLTIICFLLFIGCMGKSAQVGLHTWLPDAMEGPTPVSALIHAATMVTAGVFLLARCSPLFELAPLTREFIVVIGAITCLMAATIALVQQDIKKIIAYSTCSQLGYMFMACGLSAYGIAMFHLATHAFFKALLFLCAGNVIHSMSHEQDINKMEPQLWKKLPVTYTLMWIGSLALTGVFPFAGFYSKDLILEIAYHHNFAFIIGMVVVALTAFYSWRLIIKVFHSKNDIGVQAHESPKIMLWPLYILAALATISGFVGDKLLDITTNNFWHNAVQLITIPHVNFIDAHLPILFSAAGIGVAYLLLRYYNYKHTKVLFASIVGLLSILLFRENIILSIPIILLVILFLRVPSLACRTYKLISKKYYFDEIYECFFVKGIRNLSNRLWNIIDIKIIDGCGPNGLTKVVNHFSSYVVRLQTGFIFDYTLSMLLGIILILGLFIYIL